jgi:hypothetical protein
MPIDEKQVEVLAESQISRSDEEGQEIKWTDAEERALVRK